ncbi:hypothetical protein Ciccas_013713, partial [Cichlidogyrus casuarinus]
PEETLKDTVLVAALAWLRDPTCTVRECACRSLARLLRACPSAIPDALNGTGQSTAKSASAKAFGGLNSSNTMSPAASGEANTTATMEESTGSMSAASIESLAFLSAKGGLKALATDSNYHLRKIYAIAMQTLWGPGIPDEVPFSASGGETILGVVNASLSSLRTSIEKKEIAPGQAPKKCSPPVPMPLNQFQTCLQTVIRLLVEDPVANVRICAARCLFFMSGQIDKK